MKIVVPIVVIIAIASKSFAQSGSATPANVRVTNNIDRLSDYNGAGIDEMMYGIPLSAPEVIGSTHIDARWNKAVMILYKNDKTVRAPYVKYDIHANEIEIKTTEGVKTLPGVAVKNFSLFDSLTNQPRFFVNTKEFKTDNEPHGFFESLFDGSRSLLKRTTIFIKQADYRPEFHIGSRDDKIIKKNTLYYTEGNQVNELPHNKNKFLLLFNQKSGDIEQFINKNSLSIKDESHLIRIFEYYNTQANK